MLAKTPTIRIAQQEVAAPHNPHVCGRKEGRGSEVLADGLIAWGQILLTIAAAPAKDSSSILCDVFESVDAFLLD